MQTQWWLYRPEDLTKSYTSYERRSRIELISVSAERFVSDNEASRMRSLPEEQATSKKTLDL